MLHLHWIRALIIAMCDDFDLSTMRPSVALRSFVYSPQIFIKVYQFLFWNSWLVHWRHFLRYCLFWWEFHTFLRSQMLLWLAWFPHPIFIRSAIFIQYCILLILRVLVHIFTMTRYESFIGNNWSFVKLTDRWLVSHVNLVWVI